MCGADTYQECQLIIIKVCSEQVTVLSSNRRHRLNCAHGLAIRCYHDLVVIVKGIISTNTLLVCGAVVRRCGVAMLLPQRCYCLCWLQLTTTTVGILKLKGPIVERQPVDSYR